MGQPDTERKYSVRSSIINNFKECVNTDEETCGYILGERNVCTPVSEEDAEESETVRIVGLLTLPITIEDAIVLEEIQNDEASVEKSGLIKLALSGIPAGIEVVGVFVAGPTHLSEWDEYRRVDFLNGLLTTENDAPEDFEMEHLVWSLKGQQLVALSYCSEETRELAPHEMNILDAETSSYNRSLTGQYYRFSAGFQISVDVVDPSTAYEEEINRLLFELGTNGIYQYFLPSVQSVLSRRDLDVEDEGGHDASRSEKLSSRFEKSHSDPQSLPTFREVSLIKFHAKSCEEVPAVEVPSLSYEKVEVEQERISIPIRIDCILNPDEDVTVKEFIDLLDHAVVQQLTNHKYLYSRFAEEFGLCTFSPFHFQHEVHEHIVTCWYPVERHEHGLIKDSDVTSYRRELHKIYVLTKSRPCLKPSLSMFFSIEDGRLINPHNHLSTSNLGNGLVATVYGKYSYYHYMQDRLDDDGWGCAYRSFQTLCSWFIHQGYFDKSIPNHREIQEALVSIGDKEKNFIGSKQWIGSFEVSLSLEHFLGVKSKILHVSQGSDMGSKGRELIHHFNEQGTPIMIGGGVLAHTILGVWFNESTGETKFLILDPHYTGGDELKPVLNKGWCGWKGTDFWDQFAHYNLCLPQRPLEL